MRGASQESRRRRIDAYFSPFIRAWPVGRAREKGLCVKRYSWHHVSTRNDSVNLMRERRTETHTPKECSQQTPEGEGDPEYETI